MAADVAALEAVAKEWSSGENQFKAADMVCLGCSPSNKEVIFSWCEKCEVRQCAISKGIAQCGVCEEFPGCAKIQGMLATRNPKYGAILSMIHGKACAARKQVAATKTDCAK